jgi:hypothetical protein
MVLVRLRCRRCRGVLGEISQPPATWEGARRYVMCRRCELPDPRRIATVLAKKGLPSMPIQREVAWKDLRPFLEEALRTGKTVDVLT